MQFQSKLYRGFRGIGIADSKIPKKRKNIRRAKIILKTETTSYQIPRFSIKVQESRPCEGAPSEQAVWGPEWTHRSVSRGA